MENSDVKSIDISGITNSEVVFSEINYTELLEIFNTIKPLKTKFEEDEINIKFERCVFTQGLFFNFNQHLFSSSKLQISFIDCLIEENKSENSNSVSVPYDKKDVTIDFIYCIFRNFDVENCTLKSLNFASCIFHNSNLRIRKCDIPCIQLQNCLGWYFVIDCAETYLKVNFSDTNLFLKRRKTNDVIKKILEHEKIDKIYKLPASYYLKRLKRINVNFNKNSKSGFIREPFPTVDGGRTIEIKYYLKPKELKDLNVLIDIELDSVISNQLDVMNAYLKSLSIKGNSSGKVDIQNVKSNSIYLFDFWAKEFRFYDIESQWEESKFQITNSDMTNGLFNKVNFKSFEIVNFYKTTLEKSDFLACKFPENIEAVENIHYLKNREIDYSDAQYENYKQLKNAMSNHGSQVQALEMHKKMYGAIEKSKNLSTQDKVILFFNRISNQHGTSIWNAFWLIIFLYGLIHIFYRLSLPSAPYEFGWESWESFFAAIKDTSYFIISGLKSLFIIANPAHGIESLNELNELSTMNYVISFLSRIFLGWAYYQFVSAFRKFGKNL